MKISRTKPEYHSKLTALAKTSKKFWNYSDNWMKLWADDLTVKEDFIKEKNVFHVESHDEIIGFYSYFFEDQNIRLEHLFVLPNYIGKGIGRILVNDFFERVQDLDFEKIILDADPNVEEFYKKMGFTTIGKIPTKVSGRFLPIMVKEKSN